MSKVNYDLTAEARSDQGKGASRRLRREGKVPAIIYGAGKKPQSVMLDHGTLHHRLENEGFYSHVLSITLGGKKQKVVLKDLQRHPAKPVIMHADFLRISAKEKLRMNVPLHFINEEISPGVKIGGAVSRSINEVEVSCLPANLPEYIEIDLSQMELDETIRLSEITMPKGVELVALTHGEEHDRTIASLHTIRTIEEEDETEEVEAETESEAEEEE